VYVDWRENVREKQYLKLLEACRGPETKPETSSQVSEWAQARILSLGHAYPVRSVAVSPDGRLGLSGSSDHTARVWDMESRRSLRVLEGHSGGFWSVAWSPDGHLALSGSDDKTVRVWDVESGRSLRVLEGHSDSVLSVAWSPEGGLALSGSTDVDAGIKRQQFRR
jgi:WD40 repeat protein